MLNDIPIVQDYNILKFQNKVKEYFRLNLKIKLDIELVNDDLDYIFEQILFILIHFIDLTFSDEYNSK